MRRKFLGLAIAAVAAIGSTQAWGGDREIAEQIIDRLQTNRDSGALKDFTLDMKVDNGVVLFRGKVNDSKQKQLVLKAADGIQGVSGVTDEMSVNVAQPTAKVVPAAELEAAPVAQAVVEAKPDYSLRHALAEEARQIMQEDSVTPAVVNQPIAPGQVRPAAAVELSEPTSTSDQRIVADVVRALSRAQKSGDLQGFGVDVKSNNGVVWLKGRAASSAQRTRILKIAEATRGVQRIRNSIRVPDPKPAPPVVARPTLPQPPALSTVAKPASNRLAPMPVKPAAAPLAAQPVAAPIQAQPAPYRAPQAPQPLRTQPANATIGAPVMGTPVYSGAYQGTPVPMGGYGGGVGAPRYDSPNLPNYAWPGYAAHPNYAALTYPQQYSPTAWPYIGPFYPYPQVPSGMA